MVVWMLGEQCAPNLMCIEGLKQKPVGETYYIFAHNDTPSCDTFVIDLSRDHADYVHQ